MFLAIDPSLTSTGIVYGDFPLMNFQLKSDVMQDENSLSDTYRIGKQVTQCVNLVAPSKVTFLGIESESYNSSGKLIQLAQLNGTYRYAYATHGAKVLTYSPMTVKAVCDLHEAPSKKDRTYFDFIKSKLENSDLHLVLKKATTCDEMDALAILYCMIKEYKMYTEYTRDKQSLMILKNRLLEHKMISKKKTRLILKGSDKTLVLEQDKKNSLTKEEYGDLIDKLYRRI